MVSGFPAPPVARAAPSAFGFQVRCPQSLRFLRSGGGVETLEVVTAPEPRRRPQVAPLADRKSTRLNSSHSQISYAVFCLKKKSTRLNSSHSQISYAVFCLKKKKNQNE